MNQSATTDPALARALELHQLGRLAEAERAYREILASDAHNPNALHPLGMLLVQCARGDEAVAVLGAAVEAAPLEPEYHAGLARAHHSLGDTPRAIESMQRAVALAPESVKHLSDLGAMLQTDGRNREARDAYLRVVKQQPWHVISRYNLATLAYVEGDAERAVTQLRDVVNENPQQPKLRTTLAGYLLESGEVGEALEHCDAALASDPRDLMAMTLKAVALTRVGEREQARELMNLEQLITAQDIVTPAGYDDLDAFNAALERHVLSHPTLEHERKPNATRHGRHTDNLLRDIERGPIDPLVRIMRSAVASYLNALPVDEEHPFLKRRPPRWKLQAWAVVMERSGHQLAHTHPDGWVSGVYYVRVPPCVSDDDPGHAGWIEFGRPLRELIGDAVPDTRTLRPREGLLVLFPSYVYHHTIPFDADQHRISIAFDAVPY